MNRILAALTPDDRDALTPLARVERFDAGARLHEAGERLSSAFLPIDAVVAHGAGETGAPLVETGTVGREGVVSAVALIGDGVAFERATVHLAGDIAVLPAEAVRARYEESAAFRRLLGAYVQAYAAQVAQSIVCSATHPSEARLARWLLMSLDRTGSTVSLPLDTGLLAEMLGIGRAAVTVVTGTLQTAGLVRASRDGIRVVDRDGLEEAACDCYLAVRQVFERMLPNSYR